MKSVFFYGLFMDEDLLKAKGLHPSETTLAYVAGYGLRIGERATLVRSAQARAYGTVMQLREDELELLYGDESVADYVPVDIAATDFNGRTLSVVSYLLSAEKLTGQNSEYAKSLAAIASKVGLPTEYVGEIKMWIS